MKNKYKVIILTNIPAPYRVEGLNCVYDNINKDKYDVFVLFSRAIYHQRKFWNTGIENARFKYGYLKRHNSIDIKRFRLFDLGITIKKELKSLKPDVVMVSGYSLLSYFAVKYCIKNNIPYLVGTGATIHRDSYDKLSFIKKSIRKKIIENARGFFVYGKSAIEYLKLFNVPDNKIYYTVNSVNTNKFLEKGRKRIHKDKKQVDLLYVGNVNKMKGIKYLLDASSILQKITDIKVVLKIVGGGPELEDFKKYSETIKLKNVIFTGPVMSNDVIKYYEEADIFVFPTLDDVFGLVLVEAAASGLPIISSVYAGGSYDVIKEGYNGYVVTPELTNEFAQKMKMLVEDDKLRKQMGLYSIEVIEKEVNIEKYAKEFIRGIESQFSEKGENEK